MADRDTTDVYILLFVVQQSPGNIEN